MKRRGKKDETTSILLVAFMVGQAMDLEALKTGTDYGVARLVSMQA